MTKELRIRQVAHRNANEQVRNDEQRVGQREAELEEAAERTILVRVGAFIQNNLRVRAGRSRVFEVDRAKMHELIEEHEQKVDQ